MKYVDIQKRWKSVKKYYQSPEATAIWKSEMRLFGLTRPMWEPCEIHSVCQMDSCDWRYGHGRKGPEPAYWSYVCHAACHWTCNLHLYVARHAEPKVPWRIISSHKHSTVWDGAHRLWDGNFLALGICPNEAFNLAYNQSDSLMLPVGQSLKHPQYRLKRYRLDSLAKSSEP